MKLSLVEHQEELKKAEELKKDKGGEEEKDLDNGELSIEKIENELN